MVLGLLLTAPRWLWPDPSRPQGGRLNSQARPRLIRERSALVITGDWEALAALVLGGLAALVFTSESPDCHASAPAGSHRPGLITAVTAGQIARAAEQGRLSAAWKRLCSYGIASPVAAICAKKAKWLPPNSEYQLEGHYAQCTEAAALTDQATLRSATRRLKRGTAPDALGWTTEAWQTLLARSDLLRVLREILLQYLTGQMEQAWLGRLHLLACFCPWELFDWHGAVISACHWQFLERASDVSVGPLAQATPVMHHWVSIVVTFCPSLLLLRPASGVTIMCLTLGCVYSRLPIGTLTLNSWCGPRRITSTALTLLQTAHLAPSGPWTLR